MTNFPAEATRTRADVSARFASIINAPYPPSLDFIVERVERSVEPLLQSSRALPAITSRTSTTATALALEWTPRALGDHAVQLHDRQVTQWRRRMTSSTRIPECWEPTLYDLQSDAAEQIADLDGEVAVLEEVKAEVLKLAGASRWSRSPKAADAFAPLLQKLTPLLPDPNRPEWLRPKPVWLITHAVDALTSARSQSAARFARDVAAPALAELLQEAPQHRAKLHDRIALLDEDIVAAQRDRTEDAVCLELDRQVEAANELTVDVRRAWFTALEESVVTPAGRPVTDDFSLAATGLMLRQFDDFVEDIANQARLAVQTLEIPAAEL